MANKALFQWNPRVSKVIGDLRTNKWRTILVVLSIAVGVFAVGTVFGTNYIVEREMNASWQAITPASGSLYTATMDPETVDSVKSMRGVTEAQGVRNISVRVKKENDEWKNLSLTVIADYKDIRINKIKPLEGAWPPPVNGVLIEKTSLEGLAGAIGDTMVVETNDGKKKTLVISGTVRDISQTPSFFSGKSYGYITFDTVLAMGLERKFDNMNFIVAEQKDQETIAKIHKKVREKVEKSGIDVYWSERFKPDEHPAQAFIKPLLYLLGLLGVVSLVLGGFLVVNTVSALMLQQVRQIGVMKALGASRRQIIELYLSLVAVYGVLAMIIAIPLGIAGSHGVTLLIAWMVNIDVGNFSIPVQVYILQIAVGLVTPLLAAAYPVYSSSKVTVREALNSYGVGSEVNFGSKLTSFFEKINFLSRITLLSLRNIFRRKGRLLLTTAVLALGGAVFISIFSLRSSIGMTIHDALEYFKYDVSVDFSESYRSKYLKELALSVEGVEGVESWGGKSGRILKDGQDSEASTGIYMLAPPLGTTMIKPVVVAGRWLVAEDENALVINTEVLKKDPTLKVGDRITVKMGVKKTQWQIVGMVRGIMTGPLAYANYAYFSGITNMGEKTESIIIANGGKDPQEQEEISKNIEKTFKKAKLKVSSVQTTAHIREQIIKQFDIILAFLFAMVILMSIVGGLGLAGTMSINVIERTREIGVMRAIGASTLSIIRLILTEGLMIAMVSWLISIVLALPISYFLSYQVGEMFINAPFSYCFSVGGVMLWLIVVILITVVSSVIPAMNAARVSVREVLSYE